MTTTAIYTRISRDTEGEGLGVDRQRADCTALAARKGWDVVEVFCDNDISASTNSAKPRPAYDAMLTRIRSGEIGAVVAYSNSRLTRRPKEWLDLIDLAKSGLQIATVVSGSHDLTTADGRAMALVVAAFDAREAEATSERQRRQFAQRAASGKPQGGRYRCFGYSRSWQVIEHEADGVRWAFEQRAAGHSLTSIAKGLTANGWPTTTGKPWDAAAITKLIERSLYCGLRTHQGEVVGKATVEPIIDEALWRRANSTAVAASPGTGARSHLLSGFLRCTHCQTGMAGSTTRGGVYRCPSTRGCGRTKIRKDRVEAEVISLVMARVAASQPAPATTTPTVDLDAIDAEIEAARALYAAGDLALADLAPILKDLRAKRAEGEAQIETVAPTGFWPADSADAAARAATWASADLSARRALIGRYVDSIEIRPHEGNGKFADPGRIFIRWTDGSTQRLAADSLDGILTYDIEAQTWTLAS